MAIDTRTRKPILANGTGGLSGPAVKPVALRMVYQVAQAVRIPVVGLGGIATVEDAIEFLMAGASAIQVGTAIFSEPGVLARLIDGIPAWMRANGVQTLSEIVGSANPRFGAHIPVTAGYHDEVAEG
jgi:dihydroorotate dehydrogenase (NAD+) catalytic subunit